MPTESTIQTRIMLAASEQGMTIFRNNCGVAYYTNGQRVRYGLCPGSADLIGWRPVTITADMVGKSVAQFVAIEVKKPGGRVTAKQQNFLDRVNDAGGHGIIMRSEEDFESEDSWDFKAKKAR